MPSLEFSILSFRPNEVSGGISFSLSSWSLFPLLAAKAGQNRRQGNSETGDYFGFSF